MQEELEQCKSDGLSLCDQLLILLEKNREDAHSFFGGEVYQAYVAATENAKNSVQRIRNQIKNL